MVIYSDTSIEDLQNILYGLVTWKKHPLNIEHAESYVDDIRVVCDHLDKISYHSETVHATHLRYGQKVYAYKRNRQTTWYIIYNIDFYNNIYVQKIINNHITTGSAN